MLKVARGNFHLGLSPEDVDHYRHKRLEPIDGQHLAREVGVGSFTQSDQITRFPILVPARGAAFHTADPNRKERSIRHADHRLPSNSAHLVHPHWTLTYALGLVRVGRR